MVPWIQRVTHMSFFLFRMGTHTWEMTSTEPPGSPTKPSENARDYLPCIDSTCWRLPIALRLSWSTTRSPNAAATSSRVFCLVSLCGCEFLHFGRICGNGTGGGHSREVKVSDHQEEGRARDKDIVVVFMDVGESTGSSLGDCSGIS